MKISRRRSSATTVVLEVANGVATGLVDGLAPGYWHVEVEVLDGEAARRLEPGLSPATRGALLFPRLLRE